MDNILKKLPILVALLLSGCSKPSLLNLSKLMDISRFTAAPTTLKIEGAPAILGNVTCGAYTVSVRDQHDDLFIPTAAVSITLSTTGAAGDFFSDSGCSTSMTTPTSTPVALSPTVSSAVVYFKGSVTSGTTSLAAAATGLTAASLNVTLTSSVASLYIMNPAALQNVGVCLDVTIKTRDSLSADVITAGDVPVALSVASAPPMVGNYYSDSGCTSLITSTTVVQNTSSKLVYYKLTSVGSPTLTATNTGPGTITHGTRTLNVSGPTSLTLALTSGTQYVGNCLALTVTSNLSGATLAVGVDTTISLSDSESPSAPPFYSDSGCTASVTSVVLAASTSSKVFYYKRVVPGTPTVTASTPGFSPPGTVALAILGPTQLKFTLASGSPNTGYCLPLTIASKDSSGVTAAPAIADIAISLAQSPSVGTFYSNSGCSTSTTSATITTGSASTSTYYKTNTTGALTLTAAFAGLTSGVYSATITDVVPAITYSPSSYTFTKDSLITPISVSSATGSPITGCTVSTPSLPTGLSINNTTCQITGTPTVISAATVYTVSASNSAGTGTFALTMTVNAVAPTSISYPTPSPTYTNSVAISSNTPTSSVTSGSPITAWAISPNITTNTGLSFSTSTGVISGTPTIVASTATTYTVTASNSGGSVQTTALVKVVDQVPTLTYTGGPYSYQAGSTISTITPSYGSGGTPITCTISPSLPAGLSISNTCVVSGTVTGVAPSQSYTATPVNSGGTGATASFTLGATAAPPTKLALTGSGSYTTSYCAPYTVTVKDTYGNPSTVSADTTISLTDAAAGGAFYSDATCSTLSSSVIVTNGSSSALAYYQKPAPASVTLTSTLSTPVSPALTSATKSVTVTASTPARYSITGPATGLTSDCLTYNVNVLDSSSNAVNATSTLTANLTASGGTFYSNNTCATTATTATVASGSNTSVVYFRSTAAATRSLTVSGTGMATSSALSVVITVGPAAQIAFSTSPAAAGIAGGSCATVTVQTRDGAGANNPATSGTLNVAFSATGTDSAFYSDSGCSTSLPSNTSTIATSGTATTVYYKKPSSSVSTPGANVVITATASGTYSATANSTAFAVSTGTAYRMRASTGNAIGQKVSPLAGSCGWVTLRVDDELGIQYTPALTGGPYTINISGGGDTVYYGGNQTCSGGPVTSVTMPTGTASATVQFSYNKPTVTTTYAPPATSTGNTTISWDNGGLAGPTNTRVITISSGLADRLNWTTTPASFALNASACNSMQFGVFDENGTITTLTGPVSATTTFSLSDASDGTFYSSCTPGTAGAPANYSSSISTIAIANGGATSATFYYNKPTAGAVTLTVGSPSPSSPALGSTTKAITVSSAATKLAISISPSTSLVSGSSCSLVTVQTQNASSTATNVTAASTYTLSHSGSTALFYYDSACTASAGNTPVVSIANGQNTNSTLYVANASAGSVTYTATYTSGTPAGLTTGTTASIPYAAPAPTQLSLSGPTTVQAATGCGYYTITSVDGNAIAQNVSSTKTVTVTSTGTAALNFYSDASCSTALGSGVSIASGTSAASFFARGMTAGSAQITTATTGLTGSADAVTVTP